MSYVPPFEMLKQRIRVSGTNGQERLDMRYPEIIDLIKLMLRAVSVDEQWYLSRYPDVAAAVKSGSYKSGKHHFVEDGYFEGRSPSEFSVDESWYLKSYPDIAEGLKVGSIKSARDHFVSHGYAEGRLPSEF